MSKQTTREKLAAQLHAWSVPATGDVLLDCADRILAIMAPKLREAFMAGWVASFKEAELSSVWIKQAQADALRRWPDKE